MILTRDWCYFFICAANAVTNYMNTVGIAKKDPIPWEVI